MREVFGSTVVSDEPTVSPIATRDGAPVLWTQTRTLTLADGTTAYGCAHCDYTSRNRNAIRPHLARHNARRKTAGRGRELSFNEVLDKLTHLNEVTADREPVEGAGDQGRGRVEVTAQGSGGEHMMSAVATPGEPRPRRSRYESAILAAIGAGANVDGLLRHWAVADVAATLQRHGLVADEQGRLTRKRRLTDLVYLAQQSASPYVRQAAEQAAVRMQATSATTSRVEQHRAIEVWIMWLTAALAEAKAQRHQLRSARWTE